MQTTPKKQQNQPLQKRSPQKIQSQMANKIEPWISCLPISLSSESLLLYSPHSIHLLQTPICSNCWPQMSGNCKLRCCMCYVGILVCSFLKHHPMYFGSCFCLPPLACILLRLCACWPDGKLSSTVKTKGKMVI